MDVGDREGPELIVGRVRIRLPVAGLATTVERSAVVGLKVDQLDHEAGPVDQGVIDEHALVPTILPELGSSAWSDATVRDVLDMRVGIEYVEDYTDPASDVWRFLQCTGMIPAQPGNEAISVAEVLPSFAKHGEHGEAFSYQEPNIFVLVWLVRRTAGGGRRNVALSRAVCPA